VGNADRVDPVLEKARKADFGIIAMKAARAVHPDRRPGMKGPQHFIDRLNKLVPGDMHLAQKAYIQALKNPAIAGCVSSLKSLDVARDNLSIVPKNIS